MCGISGFLNIKGNTIQQDVLDQMLHVQHHRGPDFQGKYYDSYVGFAHNRLSLLDLSSAGNQPFQDDKNVLVFNGEIYNYRELKKELPDKAYASSSDTAVLFEALKYWGVSKTISKLKGMFAFSWFDKEKNELFLVRDRIGIKPLFYGIDHQQTLFFASEVKALLLALNCKPNPFKVLYSSLGVLERSRKETAWDNISHVVPGTYIKVDSKGIEEVTYHTVFDTVNETAYNRLLGFTKDQVLHEFEGLFEESVNKMCISDAPMGAFVSGGIDSSLIAYYASKNTPDIKLFTANVLGKHSEYQEALLLSESLNKPLYDYKYEKEMALRDWASVTWHYESPVVVHFNAIPFSGVSKLTREHQVKAVLTGEGADELFLGYSPLVAKRYEKIVKLPFDALNLIYGCIPKLKSFVLDNGGSQNLLGLFNQASQNFSNEMIFQDNPTYNFLPKSEQEEHFLTSKMLQDHIVSLLWRNDRMGMIHSIESRFPFLDEDIIAFSMNLPVKFKIGKTHRIHNYKHPFLVDKFLIRKLAENKLPKSLVQKKKKGFPTHGLRDVLVKPAFFYNGTIADILMLNKSQVDYMCSNKNNYLPSLLASVEIWAKLFIEKKSIEEVTMLIENNMKIN